MQLIVAHFLLTAEVISRFKKTDRKLVRKKENPPSKKAL